MYLYVGYFERFLGRKAILISGNRDGLRKLAGRLRSLENPRAEPLEVHELPFVQPHGGIELTAYPVDAERGVRRAVPGGLEPRFTWHYSQEGWLEAAEKIEPVADHGGHQYLECIGVEDATIIVSSGEYDEGWWKKRETMDNYRVFAGKAGGRVRIAFLIAAAAVMLSALIVATWFIGRRDQDPPVVGPPSEGVSAKETPKVVRHLTLEVPGPPLTLEEIQAFEREIGGRLPDDYKKFMLAHNGGLTKPKLNFPCEGETERVDIFYKLLPAAKDSGIRGNLRRLRELNPANVEGYLPIAGSFGEGKICLAYRGKNAGAVFYTVFKYKKVFRGDLVPVDVTMAPLANSFTEFLDSLVEIPEPYCRIEDLGKRGTPDDLAQYLAEGHSINAVGNDSLTIVREAIRFDNAAMLRACIERGASLSGSIETAVSSRHTHLIEMLVKAGADINERDELGNTPLGYVVGWGLPGEEGARNRELRDLLFKLGAINPRTRIEDLGERGTADDLARYLAEGHSIDAVNDYDVTIVREAIESNNLPMVRACIQRGASLRGTIHTAVKNSRTEFIEMLVRAGADVNERDEIDLTPLGYVLLALPGEEGAHYGKLRDLLIKLGAVK